MTQVQDPNSLLMSSEYDQNYRFGPRDAQDMVDQAGRTVGNRNLAEQDALQRAAFSAGNTNPMALAALPPYLPYDCGWV